MGATLLHSPFNNLRSNSYAVFLPNSKNTLSQIYKTVIKPTTDIPHMLGWYRQNLLHINFKSESLQRDSNPHLRRERALSLPVRRWSVKGYYR